MKVRQSTNLNKINLDGIKVIRTCKQCPVFDTLDQEILDMIQTQNPGVILDYGSVNTI